MDWKSVQHNLVYRKYWLQAFWQKRFNKPVNGDFAHHYYFIHIPKTSGTSFRFMLYHQFSQNRIYPNIYDLNEFNGRYPRIKELMAMNLAPIRERAELFIGHYAFTDGARIFEKPVRYLIFLRDPVKRTLSNILHLKRLSKDPNVSLMEILESKRKNMTNFQTRLLCNTPWHPRIVPFPVRYLQEAKDNLAKIDYIGLSEEFDLSVRLAERMFDWDLGEPLSLNTKPKKDKAPVSDEVLATVTEICQLDIELYAYAQKLFREKLKTYHLD